MPVSDGKIKITDSDLNSYEFEMPEFGYETIIQMPIDYIKTDNGIFNSFDYGVDYDKRICNCSMITTTTDQDYFDKFFLEESYEGRYKEVTIELNTSSGFYPFGPDKGDGGSFEILLKASREGIQDSPFRRFRNNIEMINVGNWPAYSAPSEITEGNLQIGDVSGLRFPENYFNPEIENSNKFIIPEDASEFEYLDKGFSGDSFQTNFQMICNNSKAYDLIYELTQAKRDTPFIMACQDYNYPFGLNKGNIPIEVKLIQNEIKIVHEKFNRFVFDLNFSEGNYNV